MRLHVLVVAVTALVVMAAGAGNALARNGDDSAFGLSVFEALQVRITRIDGVPGTFSNVTGLGFLLQVGAVEFTPQAHLVYSFTEADVHSGDTDSKVSANGLGWEVGMRLAAGWIRTGEGFYFFMLPLFSSWSLDGEFESSELHVSVKEFGTQFGIGVKVRLASHARLDLFTSFLHIGVRPGEREVVDVTSYPSIAFGVDLLL